jgi:plastocyanin domain-containing protein
MKAAGIIVVLALFCGTGFSQESVQKVFNAIIDADGVQRVSISAGEYFFDPNYIVVKVNTPVEISIKKTAGFVPHNIVINAPEAGIAFDESLGSDEKVIRFTPTKTGEFPFYCTKRFLFFKSHRERGMKGIVKVIE